MAKMIIKNGLPGIFGLAMLMTLLLSAGAGAHFLLNLNVRIFHVEHVSDGLRIYLQTPMPYLVADKVGPDVADELPEPAPSRQMQGKRGRWSTI